MGVLYRYLFPLFLFLAPALSAQPYFQWDNSLPVQMSGTNLPNAWAGGLNFVQVSNIDLDQDGKKDVVTFDRSGSKLRTFINNAEADIAASAIEAAGIEVTIHRDASGGLQPALDMGGIQLVVPDADLEAANEVLNSFAQAAPDGTEPDELAPEETAPEE